MSTVKNNTTQKRFAILAQMSEKIFHFDDLANLWQIQSKNTLHTTLKRYVQKGLFYRIYRGLYAIDRVEKLDPYLLGCKALHSFCYVGGESVLEKEGIIFQKVYAVTLFSQKSRHFQIGNNRYHCRQLKNTHLFNPIGIIERDGVKYATVERAVADLLYFNPKYYFDADNLIDWGKVKSLQKEIGYTIKK